MFNIGSGEMVLLFVVALMIFGPQRLPEMGRAMGEAMSSFRKAMQSLSEPLVAEVHSQTRQLREPAPAAPTPGLPATTEPVPPEPVEESETGTAPKTEFETPVPMTVESPS
ncbi:twin-arginine translocase TatA/TatE family subunit [bacterium CPR1]|nr:twin-arginine translocase TatA/TatE family subunit [bacterium CPR1]